MPLTPKDERKREDRRTHAENETLGTLEILHPDDL